MRWMQGEKDAQAHFINPNLNTSACQNYASDMYKNSIFRSIPIFLLNLATFEKNGIFGHPKRPFRTPIAPKCDKMWYEIFSTSLVSAHSASFMSWWPLLKSGGFCISLVGKHPKNVFTCAKTESKNQNKAALYIIFYAFKDSKTLIVFYSRLKMKYR